MIGEKIDDENRISVVIPVYNREKRIGKCLDSIIKQTHKADEIIVIDDCSADRTSDIVKKYQEDYTDSNIIYEKLEKNSGAQVARNKGIDIASGKWICFCDSDDEWLENKLEVQLNVLKDHNYNEYVVIHGNCKVHDISKKCSYVWNLPVVQGNDCYKNLLNSTGPMFQAMLTSKKALLEVGKLGEDIKTYQEWDTSLRLAKKM
ncbi:Glycosyl transferase, family 2 [Anaerovibrio sp. JC8]|uniref:glycosyltransferase family 2 protein n=1 Tax=Anaerovibrio sp. JC8 TaxID=1240085 RepID=UPI000A0B1B4B|nr:glycosyltransferase family 2 protein [Anaerovibrio sp. JC8]ORU00541.1 Glycosyl transferase, family 2 [Anaerovibrio sp. JC8]